MFGFTFALLSVIVILILGMACLPLVIFVRARRDAAWDDSNMSNIFRVVAHLATHPSDFGRMQYEDGKKPFWYINKDELSDVVNVRPNSDKTTEKE